MNRSTEGEEKKWVPRKLVVQNSASPTTKHLQIGETRWRVRLRGARPLGVGGVGGRLVPVWDKSGTVHEVNRRQARHGERGSREDMATTSSPALGTSISGIAHSKTPILGRGDRHRGTSQSLDKRLISRQRAHRYLYQHDQGVGEAAGRDKQHPAHTSTQQSAREGSCDCLDGLWPFAVTAFTRNPYATPTLTQKLSRLADEAIPSSRPQESHPVDSSWSHIGTPISRPRPSPICGSPPLTVAG